MTDLIIIGILLVIVGSAVFYIVRAKKNGAKCIGCPRAGSCRSRNDGLTTCNCNSQGDEKNRG